MPSWADLYPYVPFSDQATGQSGWEVDPADPTRECRYEYHDLADSPEEIVTFGLSSSALWPGVLIQGDGFAGGLTTMQQLPIRQREPAAVFVDFGRHDIRRTVNYPTPGNLAAAVGDIIEQAGIGGYQPGTDVFYESTETFGSDQMALHLGLLAKYMKSSLKAKLDMERSATESTLTIYFKEAAFDAVMEQPQTPGEIFSDDLTQALLDRQIDLGRLDHEHNIPVYVSSVTYGRILIFSITSSASIADLTAAVEGVYNGGTFKASAEARAVWRQVRQSSRTRLITVGGSSAAAAAAIRSGDFTRYFTVDPALSEFVPISYVLRDLGGAQAYLGETTEYAVRECRPVQQYDVRITFNRAHLMSHDDPDLTSGYELDRFFLETHAYDRMYATDPGTHVFDTASCGWWTTEEGLKAVHCWANPGSTRVGQGGWWQPNEAALGQWYLDIPFDDTGTTGYLDFARIQLRAGFRDYDAIGANDWTRGHGAILDGSAIWEDHLPGGEFPEDESTYMFEMSNGGARWQVNVTIELVPRD
jgi:hypothetical protein